MEVFLVTTTLERVYEFLFSMLLLRNDTGHLWSHFVGQSKSYEHAKPQRLWGGVVQLPKEPSK